MKRKSEGALALADAGFRVFPLHTPSADGQCSCGRARCGSSGKHPRTARGFIDATADARIIRRWWARWPDANVGLATGGALAVLDVDPRNGGAASLETVLARQARGKKIPPTPEVLTGGGGRHYYFATEGSVRSRVLGPGLDLKAAGGYVVAPNSLHSSGQIYAWHPRRPLDIGFARLPQWVARIGPSRQEGGSNPSASDWVRIAGDGAREGSRNATCARLAGHLLARKVDPAVVLSLLVAWDAHRNRPPLGEDEVTKTVASVVRAEARKLEQAQR